MVFVPEYVVETWWERMLHNSSAARLKARLLHMPGVVMASVPWQFIARDALEVPGAAAAAEVRRARDDAADA